MNREKNISTQQHIPQAYTWFSGADGK